MKNLMILLTAISFALPASAGRMKDLVIAHEEAVLEFLFGTTNSSDVTFEGHRFSEPELGGDIAVTSEVHVLDVHSFEFIKKTCTTEFNQFGPQNYQPTNVSCN
ncbi:MAG: hypothetical protein ACLGGX_10250 [Bdellovibrionia bacterium]